MSIFLLHHLSLRSFFLSFFLLEGTHRHIIRLRTWLYDDQPSADHVMPLRANQDLWIQSAPIFFIIKGRQSRKFFPASISAYCSHALLLVLLEASANQTGGYLRRIHTQMCERDVHAVSRCYATNKRGARQQVSRNWLHSSQSHTIHRKSANPLKI